MLYPLYIGLNIWIFIEVKGPISPCMKQLFLCITYLRKLSPKSLPYLDPYFRQAALEQYVLHMVNIFLSFMNIFSIKLSKRDIFLK